MLTRRRLIAAVPVLAAPAIARAAAETPDVGRAKSEGKVVLYTSLDTKIVDQIITGFRKKYGIDVSYFRGGSADVTSKVLAESDAGQVQADIVDASDVGAFLVMKDRGLLKPYASSAAASVPVTLRDPDGTWTADRLTQAVIEWNTNKVAGHPPTSWQDLAESRFKGQLSFFSSANGDGAPRLYTLAKHLGWDLLKQYAATQPLRVNTPQLMTQILETGERTAGFLQNDNIAWRSKREGKPTDYLFPAEGMPTEPGAVGLMKKAQHPNAAMLFYDWWMDDAGQKLLVDGGKYSSRTDLAPPTGSPPLAKLKLMTIDYAVYQKDRSDILQKMTDIFGGEWGV